MTQENPGGLYVYIDFEVSMNFNNLQSIVLATGFITSLSVIGSEEPSKEIKAMLEKIMLKNGDITAKCISENSDSVNNIYVEHINLNHDSQPEYLVSGVGSCCGGARRCNQWIYQKSRVNYRKIFGGNDGLQGDVELLKGKTKGYRNIEGIMYGGQEAEKATYKYNGRVYQRVGPIQRIIFR